MKTINLTRLSLLFCFSLQIACPGDSNNATPIDAGTSDDEGDDPIDDDEPPMVTEDQELVITYEQMPVAPELGNADDLFTFQLVLRANGEFETLHRSVHSSVNHVIGVFNNINNTTAEYTYDTFNALDNSQIKFVPIEDGYISAAVTDLYDEAFKWRAIDGEEVSIEDGGFASFELPFELTGSEAGLGFFNISDDGFVWLSETAPTEALSLSDLDDIENTIIFAGFAQDYKPNALSEIRYELFTRSIEEDCAGVRDGFAFLDDCLVCVEGTSGVRANTSKDCKGRCNGEAAVNECGNCYDVNETPAPEDVDLGCGCGLGEPKTVYADTDGDGLGAGAAESFCPQEIPTGYVENNDDIEPDCATNDTAECGACGQLACDGVCGSGAYVDECGDCLAAGEVSTCSGVDLVVDAWDLAQAMSIQYMFVDPNTCLVAERCVSGTGDRKLLRFSTSIANIGSEDLMLGRPENGNPLWEYDQCHEHFHFEAYADYRLTDNVGEQVRDLGHKNGFSVQDLDDYDLSDRPCSRRYSDANQGISSGCVDIYNSALECQWIDVTSLPNGQYTLEVNTNPQGVIPETNLANNPAKVTFVINGDEVYVSSFENVGRREQEDTRTVSDLPNHLQLQEFQCDDNMDNDGDNLVDCEDPNCRLADGCFETSCTDGVSNDQDDLVDCEDPDCAFDDACYESLGNETCENPPVIDLSGNGTQEITLDMRVSINGMCGGGRHLFYQFVAPADGQLSLRDLETDDLYFRIDRNGCNSANSACDGWERDSADFSVNVGQSYILVIGDHRFQARQATDRFSIEFTPDQNLATGDICEDAIPLSFSSNDLSQPIEVEASTIGRLNTSTCDPDASGPDTWYSFLAPGDGTVTIQGVSDNFDTYLTVYENDCDILNNLVCRDEDDQDVITLPVSHSRRYFVVADGFGGESGQIQLRLQYSE